MHDVKTAFDAAGFRVGLVATRFNGNIVERLIAGARETLLQHGVLDEHIELVRVPGAWEVPAALDALAESGRFDALVALGAVIRGETPHFDYICNECAAGCARVTARTGLAVGFGVLTCDDAEQAAARAGGKAGNKGREAAEAALEMACLLQSLKS
ncbi:MAG: 6,7-dimethyl-8-ribityllumazine synthase [Holophagales bacterium]|nr:6,7-dimethyl-8-ribityllumazine synthase [Holophagales bacterium]MYG32123.1 6,7-dimethyl-8-ribityllumazine synthase [Holophagales bacterium]MYI80833.1 6,7-dimethyl-8-ribityllumazine synthase [Holophagales bacterium]